MINFTVEQPDNLKVGEDRTGQLSFDVPLNNQDVDYSIQIHSYMNSVDTAFGALDTLDNMRKVITDGSEELDPSQQKLSHITMEGICRSLGIESHVSVSVESYTNKSVAVESIGGLISAIWEAILNTLKKIWEAILYVVTLGKSSVRKSRQNNVSAAIQKLSNASFASELKLTGPSIYPFRHLHYIDGAEGINVSRVQLEMSELQDTVQTTLSFIKEISKLDVKIKDFFSNGVKKDNTTDFSQLESLYKNINSFVESKFKKLNKLPARDFYSDDLQQQSIDSDVYVLPGFVRGELFAAVKEQQDGVGFDYRFTKLEFNYTDPGDEFILIPDNSALKSYGKQQSDLQSKVDDVVDEFSGCVDFKHHDKEIRSLVKELTAKSEDDNAADWNRQAQQSYKQLISLFSAMQRLVMMLNASSDVYLSLCETFIARIQATQPK